MCRKYYLFLLVVLVSYSCHIKAEILIVPLNFPTVQEAINTTQPFDTVLVEEGRYEEILTIPTHAIMLTSGYLYDPVPERIEATVLAAPAEVRDSLWRVISIGNGLEDTVRINGFTIRDGQIIRRARGREDFGAAFYANRCNIVISNNHFVQNRAEIAPGGCISIDSSSIMIINNRFEENYTSGAGGAILIYYVDGIISSNIFQSNESVLGGAIKTGYSDALVVDNMFHENRTHQSSNGAGGAIFIGQGGNVEIVDNNFEDNIANYGGAITGGPGVDTLIIQGNYLYHNQIYTGAAFGPAICIEFVINSVLIESNIIYDNSYMNAPGAIFCMNNATITRNIFFRNRCPEGAALFATSNEELITIELHGNAFIENEFVPGNYHDYGIIHPSQNSQFNMTGNDFYHNRGFTIGDEVPVNGSFTTIDSNYWGHITGPYHQLLNPTGAGDSIPSHIAYEQYFTHPLTPYLTPRAVWEPDTVRFDTVDVGDSRERTIKIENRSALSLELSGYRVSDERFFCFDEFPIVVEPFEETLLHILFLPQGTGEVRGTLEIDTNQPGVIVIPLKGYGVSSELESDPSEIPEKFRFEDAYPNPTNGQLQIKVGLPDKGTITLEMYNTLGERVMERRIEGLVAGYSNVNLPMDRLASGVYLVRAGMRGDRKLVRKVVLLR